MQVTFYGAVREVTGSMHLVSNDTDRILLDCGMFQGRRKEAEQKNKVLPFDPAIVSNMILSHAHIDHSGRVPLLAKYGFNGRIITTRVTHDACRYMLPDSAHIQESDADYLNYKTARNALYRRNTSKKGGQVSKRKQNEIRKMLKQNKHGINNEAVQDLIGKYQLAGVEPLYTSEDAALALTLFEGQPYRREVTVGKGMTCKFYEAGHILGSAVSILRYQGYDGRKLTVAYTGDLGRFDKPILRDPALQFEEEDRQIDLLIMESTYGDRLHDPVVDLKPRLKTIIEETHRSPFSSWSIRQIFTDRSSGTSRGTTSARYPTGSPAAGSVRSSRKANSPGLVPTNTRSGNLRLLKRDRMVPGRGALSSSVPRSPRIRNIFSSTPASRPSANASMANT